MSNSFCKNMLSFLLDIYVYILGFLCVFLERVSYLKELSRVRKRGRETENLPSIFLYSDVCICQVYVMLKQDPGASSGSSKWISGAQRLDQFFATFSGP